MADIEIKRGYEVLPDNNIRFGIKITNNTDSAISDVEVILDYTKSLFNFEGEKIQTLGNIPPTIPRTAKFILKPLGCIHKENIEATIQYRDHKWEKHLVKMRPKEVHCVCPFLKGKPMNRGEFVELSELGHTAEAGLNFQGVDAARLTSFLVQTCKSRHYKVDEHSIEGGTILYLASESIGEKAYYLLTAYIKETDGLIQVMLRAVSDKPHGLNGFLNEMVGSIRHIVSTVQSAREIGVIRKEQVINIIDSVVQRSTFAGGEGVAEVNIEGSIVQRTKIAGVEVTAAQTPQYSPVDTPTAVTASSDETPKTVTNFIGMEFVLIPAGEFKMGSPLSEKHRDSDEGPVHTVTIKKAYYMSKYEVTQKQWREVMDTNPSNFKGDDLPVERVSWNDAQEFIKKLNKKESTDKYRLPSEAEWESAARAGTTTPYSFGNDESNLSDYAWYYSNSGSKTHPVGQKQPNPWGLYDMHGNVWEWVQDKWHSDYDGAPTDGIAWESGSSSYRVRRGGGWLRLAESCRSASRNNRDPGDRSGNFGFRLLQEI